MVVTFESRDRSNWSASSLEMGFWDGQTWLVCILDLYLSICLFVYLSICLFVYLSICQHVSTKDIASATLDMGCGANFEALPGPSFNSEMPSSSRYLVPCHHICSWYLHLSIFVGYIFVGSLEHTDSTVPGSIVCSCVSPLRPEVFFWADSNIDLHPEVAKIFLSRFKYRSRSWREKSLLCFSSTPKLSEIIVDVTWHQGSLAKILLSRFKIKRQI